MGFCVVLFSRNKGMPGYTAIFQFDRFAAWQENTGLLVK
jgi:hypothetical protein